MTSAKTLLIVYHSHTGGTRQMVDAACAGAVAADSGVEVRLRAVPEHSGRLAGRYRFLQGTFMGLELGAGVTTVSRRELTLPNTASLGGLTLVDAQATYPLGALKVGLSIVNLFGSDAFEPYQYLGGAFVTPTQSRSAFLTLRTQF